MNRIREKKFINFQDETHIHIDSIYTYKSLFNPKKQQKKFTIPSSPVVSIRIGAGLAIAFKFCLSFVRSTQYINQHKAYDGENETWQEFDDDWMYPKVDSVCSKMREMKSLINSSST